MGVGKVFLHNRDEAVIIRTGVSRNIAYIQPYWLLWTSVNIYDKFLPRELFLLEKRQYTEPNLFILHHSVCAVLVYSALSVSLQLTAFSLICILLLIKPNYLRKLLRCGRDSEVWSHDSERLITREILVMLAAHWNFRLHISKSLLKLSMAINAFFKAS